MAEQTAFEQFFGMAPGRWLPGTAVATPKDIEVIQGTTTMVALGLGPGVGGRMGLATEATAGILQKSLTTGVLSGTLSKAVGSGMVLGGGMLALAGQEVRTVGLPAILGKVFSGIGKVAKGVLGLGGGAVAAGVGGAAVGAVAATAVRGGGGGKRRRHRRGLTKKEIGDLMMMKAIMGPGAAKSPAFQLAMMKAY